MTRKIVAALALAVAMGACTNDFQSINVNPNAPSSVPLPFLLGQVQLMIDGSSPDPGYKTWRANLIYSGPMVQQLASTNNYYTGDKYVYSVENVGAYFADSYSNSVKNLVNLIALSKADPASVNTLSIARILKVFQMHLITDMYGDAPYSEAGLGYLNQLFSPKYDLQKDIYADMLKELDEAGKALSASAAVPTSADFSFGGDITKWKKFANSLMLRLAMRMQKVDPAMAQTWAKKAVDGGLMTSNDDTYTIKHSAGPTYSINPNSYNLSIFPSGGRNILNEDAVLWSKTLIDMMKARKDPRVNVIAAIAGGDMTPSKQKGLPNGYDNTTGTAFSLASVGDANLKNYSRPSPLMINAEDPTIYVTYAETRFLLAEAIERGWATGSAKDEYAKGQAAALSQLVLYDATAAITNTADYVAANPYPTGTLDEKMAQIHNEMFVLTATTMNFYEGWANWRRTGLPKLTPVNYPGNSSGGQIPRRLRYPPTEAAVNPNYNAANDRQGGDSFNSRVWWDKQ